MTSFTYPDRGVIGRKGWVLKIWQNQLLRRTIVGVAMALMVGTVSYLYVFGQKAKTTPAKIIPDHVDIQVKNVVYTDIGAEGVKWEVRADLGTYLKKEEKALFDNVTITLILADGRVFKMTGDKGVLGTESKNMDLSGHVTIVSQGGDKITMDDLHYTEKDKSFKTHSMVVQENDRMKIRGRGMVLSLKTQQLKILSDVKALIK